MDQLRAFKLNTWESELQPKFYQREVRVKQISKASYAGAIIAAGATVFSFFNFRSTSPTVVFSVLGATAATAVALAVLGRRTATQTKFDQDPAFKLKQFDAAVGKILDSKTGTMKVGLTEARTLFPGLITDNDLKQWLEADLEARVTSNDPLAGNKARILHGADLAKTDLLSDRSKAALRTLIDRYQPVCTESARVMEQNWASLLFACNHEMHTNLEYFCSWPSLNQARDKKDYSVLKEGGKLEVILKNYPAVKAELKLLFFDTVVAKRIPISELTTTYLDELVTFEFLKPTAHMAGYFPEVFTQHDKYGSLSWAVQPPQPITAMLNAAVMAAPSYADLRANQLDKGGFDNLRVLGPEQVSALQELYLNQSYSGLCQYSADRAFLRLTDEDVISRLNRDFTVCDYLGEGGARQKHGFGPLRDCNVAAHLQNKVANELVTKLQGKTYQEVMFYYDDLKPLIGQEEVKQLLINNWYNNPLRIQPGTECDAFVKLYSDLPDSTKMTFQAQAFKEQRQVRFETLWKKHRHLFDCGLLQPALLADKFRTEVARLTFPDVIRLYGEEILDPKHGLFDLTDSGVRAIVRDYLFKVCIVGQHNPNNIAVLERHGLVARTVSQALRETGRLWQETVQVFDETITEIGNQYQLDCQRAETRYTQEIARASEAVATAKAAYDAAEALVKFADEVKATQELIATKEQALPAARALTAKLAAAVSDSSKQAELTRELGEQNYIKATSAAALDLMGRLETFRKQRIALEKVVATLEQAVAVKDAQGKSALENIWGTKEAAQLKAQKEQLEKVRVAEAEAIAELGKVDTSKQAELLANASRRVEQLNEQLRPILAANQARAQEKRLEAELAQARSKLTSLERDPRIQRIRGAYSLRQAESEQLIQAQRLQQTQMRKIQLAHTQEQHRAETWKATQVASAQKIRDGNRNQLQARVNSAIEEAYKA